MKQYLRSGAFISGVILLLVGTGPFAAVLLAGKSGFLFDRSPNPAFLGILAWLTFWPSIFLLTAGVLHARRQSRRERDDGAGSLPWIAATEVSELTDTVVVLTIAAVA